MFKETENLYRNRGCVEKIEGCSSTEL